MTTSEELDQKRVQAVYLQKLLNHVNEEIAELETTIDPYAELKDAHAAGKRIAVLNNVRGIKKYKFLEVPQWDGIVKDYKIVDDDITFTGLCSFFSETIKIKLNKCALTGNITAEVVND